VAVEDPELTTFLTASKFNFNGKPSSSGLMNTNTNNSFVNYELYDTEPSQTVSGHT